MLKRVWVVVLAVSLTVAWAGEQASRAEASPEEVPPLTMPKPKKKKKKPEGPGVPGAPKADACKADFEAEPIPKEKRKIKPSENITRGAEQPIEDAKLATNTEGKLRLLKEAQDALFDALKKDPYNAMATQHLAAVYAIAGRRKCAKALLERLTVLRDTKEFGQQARRAIAAARNNTAFDAMRAEADRALQ